MCMCMCKCVYRDRLQLSSGKATMGDVGGNPRDRRWRPQAAFPGEANMCDWTKTTKNSHVYSRSESGLFILRPAGRSREELRMCVCLCVCTRGVGKGGQIRQVYFSSSFEFFSLRVSPEACKKALRRIVEGGMNMSRPTKYGVLPTHIWRRGLSRSIFAFGKDDDDDVV